jgi:serine/threonine protein phosphatase 1
MNRTLVIGDIHGGLRALKQIMQRAEVTAKDKLIFLGDYVDSWSESPQVLDFLIGLQRSHDCVFMRGNHDDLLMQWLNGKENELWYQHGGEATIVSYSGLDSQTKRSHENFLANLRDYYLDDHNRLFVHAGFTNMHGIDHEHFKRLAFWDRTLWETAVALDKNLPLNHPHYPKRLTLYKEVYIGHTPVTKLGKTIPVQMGPVWNVDTGAAFYGPLTVMDVNTKAFWQSDPLPDLYPQERGRN